MDTMFIIEKRELKLINTDPQRRCYNGCHFSSELVWSDWDWLCVNVPENMIEEKLKFWRDLSDYAVSQRGESARSEYRVRKVPIDYFGKKDFNNEV